MIEKVYYKNTQVDKLLNQNIKMFKSFELPNLFSNGEQGFWYDPSDLNGEKLKFRRNLLTKTDLTNGLADVEVRNGNITPVEFIGVNATKTGLLIGNTNRTVDIYAYKAKSDWKANVPYTFSVFMRTLDGSEPLIINTGTSTTGDIGLVIKGTLARDSKVTNLGGGLYRVQATFTSSLVNGGVGVVKYRVNSARDILVTGYQLEEGEIASDYQPFTDFNSEFITSFPNHAIFQDSTGMVPVSAFGQPVGLILDKSKHLELGPELYTGALPFTVFRDASSATNGPVTRLIAGKFYKVTLNVASNRGTMSGAFRIQSQVTNFLSSPSLGLSNGKVEFILSPIITGDASIIGAANGVDFTIDSYSIREIAGNHAYQTTSASRPILRRNTVTGSNYLEFDGLDDYLRTTTLSFPNSDKISIFTGVKKLGTAASIIMELGANSNSTNGSFGLFTDTVANSYVLRKRGVGTPSPFADAISTQLPAPHTAVISSRVDFSKIDSEIKVNGNYSTSQADSGVSPSITNAPLNIGRRNGSSLPLYGHIYGMIIVNRLVSDIEIEQVEKELIRQTGVTFNV